MLLFTETSSVEHDVAKRPANSQLSSLQLSLSHCQATVYTAGFDSVLYRLLDGVLYRLQVISEGIFTDNHLTGAKNATQTANKSHQLNQNKHTLPVKHASFLLGVEIVREWDHHCQNVDTIR